MGAGAPAHACVRGGRCRLHLGVKVSYQQEGGLVHYLCCIICWITGHEL